MLATKSVDKVSLTRGSMLKEHWDLGKAREGEEKGKAREKGSFSVRHLASSRTCFGVRDWK